jgi:bifunctional non-homologous end joining protein LigD
MTFLSRVEFRLRTKSMQMPGFIKPQLATLKSKAPTGEQWLHEIKYDGYRIQLQVYQGKKRAFTRNGLDWTTRFSAIAGAFKIPGQAIIDGEVVVVEDGRTNFSALQAELAAGRQDRLVFYAFDLLWRDGDLRKIPQIARKAALLNLFEHHELEAPVLYSEHLIGDGQKMFEHAAKLRWEGIISKRADAPYKSERGEAWLKVKTVQREKFPVVGFIKDPTGVAALYLGKEEAGQFRYVGKVGTGWSRTVSSQIRKQLDTVVSPKSKLTKPVRNQKLLGWSRCSLRISSIAISRRKACFGQVRSRGSRVSNPRTGDVHDKERYLRVDRTSHQWGRRGRWRRTDFA